MGSETQGNKHKEYSLSKTPEYVCGKYVDYLASSFGLENWLKTISRRVGIYLTIRRANVGLIGNTVLPKIWFNDSDRCGLRK